MMIRASRLGACLLGQIAEHLGHEPIAVDEASRARMQEGALHEDDVVSRLTADGYTITRQQEEVTLARVTGHLDGIIYSQIIGGVTPARVLEIKSMSKDAYKTFTAKGWYGDWPDGSLVDRYRWQVSVYMHATGLEALLVTKDRNSGQIAQHGIETPYYSLSQITDRVALIEDHVARRQLLTVCPHDWFCDYRYLCPAVSGDGTVTSVDSEPVPLEVVRYWELGQQAAELKAAREELRPAVEAFLGTATKLEQGGYRITRTTRTTAERVVPASTQVALTVKKIEKETD